jgi:hypothetical protein
MSGGTEVPNIPGTDNKPKVIEPDANAAQAKMTSYETEKMARPGADPAEVAREGTKGEDNPEKLRMTTMACNKIHIFTEAEVTFKAPIFDPGQFNKYGQAARIVKLHIRIIIVTDDFTDMMPSHHNLVESATESEDPPLKVSRSKEDQGRQLEALTEGKDSDNRQDEGVHDGRHQKFTAPNHEITSPIDITGLRPAASCLTRPTSCTARPTMTMFPARVPQRGLL